MRIFIEDLSPNIRVGNGAFLHHRYNKSHAPLSTRTKPQPQKIKRSKPRVKYVLYGFPTGSQSQFQFFQAPIIRRPPASKQRTSLFSAKKWDNQESTSFIIDPLRSGPYLMRIANEHDLNSIGFRRSKLRQKLVDDFVCFGRIHIFFNIEAKQIPSVWVSLARRKTNTD